MSAPLATCCYVASHSEADLGVMQLPRHQRLTGLISVVLRGWSVECRDMQRLIQSASTKYMKPAEAQNRTKWRVEPAFSFLRFTLPLEADVPVGTSGTSADLRASVDDVDHA